MDVLNNSGYDDVRSAIATSINNKFGTNFKGKNIIMTVGAAGGLNVIFKTLLNPKDEVIVFAPYFGEYRMYAANYDANLVVVSPNKVDFQPNLKEFEEKLLIKQRLLLLTHLIILQRVVYSEDTISKLADILTRKQKEYGTEIYLISDEPYRELGI